MALPNSRSNGFSRVFTIYGYGGHIGMVTMISQTSVHSLAHGCLTCNLAVSKQFFKKSVFEKVLNRMAKYNNIDLQQGQTAHVNQNFYSNINLLILW